MGDRDGAGNGRPAEGAGWLRRAWLVGAVLVAAGLAGAWMGLARRVAVESGTGAPIELTMDWTSLEASAVRWGRDPAALIRELAQAGLTSLAVAEQTVGSVVAEGDGLAVTPQQAQLLHLEVPGAPAGEGGPARAGTAWTWLLRPRQAPVAIEGDPARAAQVGVGLPADALEAAREAGLPALVRYADRPRAVPWVLDGPPDRGPWSPVLIFEGSRLPPVSELAAAIRAGGWTLGLVEFSPQQGAQELARAAGLAAVAVHSMKSEEIERAGVDGSADRYLRAVRERGVRVLYVRPAPTAEETVRLVSELAGGLRARGYRTGLATAAPVHEGPAPVALVLLGLGAAGLWVWAVAGWWPLAAKPGPEVVAAAGAVAALAGGLVMGWARTRGWGDGLAVLLRQAGALAIALLSPMAACAAALSASRAQDEVAGSRRPGWGAGRALAGAIAMACVSVAGGLLIAGLLSDSLFMLRLEQFRGVKLAHVLPPLAVAVAGLVACGAAVRTWLGWMGRPIRWGDAALAVAVLGAGLYYVARTGNDSATVLGIERVVRGWLEEAMAVRPRAKEFLIGYPAMALALFAWTRGWARRVPLGFAAALGAGSIAAVSVTNTFAHIHTPLGISLQRELNGLVLGLVTGAAAWLIATALERAFGRTLATRGETRHRERSPRPSTAAP